MTGDGVGPRIGEAGDEIGDPGTHRRDADAGLAGDARVGMRHHRGGLLMADVDALHAEVEARAGGTAGRSAHHEENGVDAFALESSAR